jgi:cold shock CspA family protein
MAREETTGRDSGRETGTVKWWDVQRGYGFVIRDDGRGEIFAHVTELKPGVLPETGDVVSFIPGFARGRPAATKLIIEDCYDC